MQSPFNRGFTDSAAAKLEYALGVLAQRHRLAILALLNANGQMTITDLTKSLTLAQPTVSHHVRILAEAGLVERKRNGHFMNVTLDHRAVADVASALSPWQAS